jgi:hypothetical protein
MQMIGKFDMQLGGTVLHRNLPQVCALNLPLISIKSWRLFEIRKLLRHAKIETDSLLRTCGFHR